MNPLFTFSAGPRVGKCFGSAVLPAVPDLTPRKYRDAGSEVATFLLNVTQMGRDNALEEASLEHQERLAAINLEAMPHGDAGNWAFEVGLAWDYATGKARELFRGKQSRAYDVGPTEIPGTLDVLGLTDDSVVCPDVKTGWGDLGPPRENLQFLAQAVSAARAFGKRKAVLGALRLPEDGEPWYQVEVLDDLELDEAEERLRQVCEAIEGERLAVAAGGEPTLVMGPHCKYCPAFLTCPAQMGLARELAFGFPNKITMEVNEPTTPEDACDVLERLEAAEMLVKKVRERVDEYASSRPIRFSDGRIYGKVERLREAFDPEASAPVLDQFGMSAAIVREAKLTKTAIEKLAAKQATKERKKTIIEREVFDALRAAGADRTKKLVQVDYLNKAELAALQAQEVGNG